MRRLAVVAVVLAGCGAPGPSDPSGPEIAREPAAFVGGESCGRCHGEQLASWRGSDHDLAMQVADEATVLGDFDDATFTSHGVTSTFFRRNGKFFVRTDGPDGELSDYEVAYTFGVRPLQQYLIEFPGGRMQALSLCWDARPSDEGGQRWFHLYPDEPVHHDDPLHWTGPNQNWNYMCAECHSTNLVKGYDLDSDQYETTWSEVNVSCEACHGPGSNHVAWAESGGGGDEARGLTVSFRDPNGGRWVMDRDSGIAKRSAPLGSKSQIETCARCHSRRSAVHDDYVHGRPLMDTHRPSLIEDGLYHPDGQILDEVYVYGSFLQSKMHREGVVCADCHDPHSLETNGSGNAVCAGCHLTTKYDTEAHHFHDPVSETGRCTACHMPERTYMVVDPRGDHSFRVPRPDLTVAIGTPNACNDCHTDQTAEWAADVIAEWRGPGWSPAPHFGTALHAGRVGRAGAEAELARLAGDGSQPAIARATALASLRPYAGRSTVVAVEIGVRDEDPMVRAAAVDAAETFPPGARVPMVAPRLADPVRQVRMTAARVLAPLSSEHLAPEQLSDLEFALAEYVDSQLVNAERAESHVNLGTLYMQLREYGQAERSFETALSIDPRFVPGYVNFADLHRARGRDDLCEQVLRRGIEVVPEDGDVRHALGLALVRQQRYREAVEQLERAVELSPGRARYRYVLGVALNDVGQSDRALAVLELAHARHPADRDILFALASMHGRAGARDAGLEYAEKLLQLAPKDPAVQQLVQQLRASGS